MEKITLTEKEKSDLELRHKLSRDKRESDRIKTVLLYSEGWSTGMISQALRKHESSILRHLKEYLSDKKLKPVSGGSQSYLTESQTEELISHLTETIYHHQRDIISYIKSEYLVEYSIPGMNKWLKMHGFSYKQPKGVPHKFDSQQQDEFIANYEELKESLGTDEALLFMDSAHPTQATKVSSGWIRKGLDKAVKTTGSRTRLNLVGAIRLGHLSEAVVEQYEKVNGDTIIDFFEKVKEQYSSQKTIHIVLDGAGYHKKKEVQETAEKLGIKLHYLPPYSPNLNPIERLWLVMNKHVRNNRYFESTKEFRQKITKFFKTTLPNIGSSLDSTINDCFQKLLPT